MPNTWISAPSGSLAGEFPAGYQCADCGFYFPRTRIKDVGGEYYCRRGMGHNHAPAGTPVQPAAETSSEAAMVTSAPAAVEAPSGTYSGLLRLMQAMPTDAARFATIGWLASPAGSTYLGSLKDAIVVAARLAQPAATYPQTAAHLATTVNRIHQAISRHRARTQGGTR